MSSSISNKEIADILYQYAELLEIDGANQFRVIAYEDAARTVMNRSTSLAKEVGEGADISLISNIGSHLKGVIEEIINTGEFIQLIALEQSMSPQIVALSHIPGIGVKKVQAITEFLAPFDFKKLQDMANAGTLKTLPGIGPKTENSILNFFNDL